MNRHFILFAIAFAAALSGFAKTFDVDISTGRPAASNEAYYHGETIEFRAVRGRSVVTNVEYSCVYYQTNGMDSVWWHTDGLVFHPTNDVGAASYRFFLEGRDDLGRDWHANGLLRLLPSPGFTPNAIEPPIVTLDFANIEVANAPYYNKAETEAKIVELAPAPDFSTNNTELVETIHQAEVDPNVPAWAKRDLSTMYSQDLYPLLYQDFYANDKAIKSQHPIWVKGNASTAVTVGRGSSTDNSYPYARQNRLGFSAYEDLDHYAHYRSRGIYIWPWWDTDAENVIAYLFPTNGNGGTFALTSDIPSVPTAQINAAATTNALQDAELESHASQLSQLSQSLDGKVPTSRTINGKALTSNISLSADEVGATTPEDVTAAIREQSLGGIWDETLQVWWTPVMRNGSLTYQATTNVNLNAEN